MSPDWCGMEAMGVVEEDTEGRNKWRTLNRCGRLSQKKKEKKNMGEKKKKKKKEKKFSHKWCSWDCVA